MYRLVNSSGNVFKETDSKAKRDYLVAEGYTDITAPEKSAKKAAGGKKTGNDEYGEVTA